MYFGWCVFLTLSVMFIQVRIRRKVNTDNPPVYLLLFEVAGSWLVGVLIG